MSRCPECGQVMGPKIGFECGCSRPQAVQIVVTWSSDRGYSIEGQYNGIFSRNFAHEYEIALEQWRSMVNYWGEVRR